MSKIKKILGLISIGVLSIAAILGIVIREGKSEIISTESAHQEDSNVASSVQETKAAIQQPQYICVEDFLEVDENALTFASYENLEVVECIMVGCGGFF